MALADDRLTWSPTWTRIDNVQPSLISGFDISRGKQTEQDKTDTSTAVVYVNDRWGYFDPNNVGSAFAGYLGKQVLLQVYDPVAAAWVQQTRMWVDHVDFDINPATRDGTSILSNVQLHCVDIFGLLSRLKMDVSEVTPAVKPGYAVSSNRVFGNTVPARREGIVFYEDSSPGDGSGFDDRLTQIASDCGLTSDWYVFFSGNVDLLEGVYDVGDSPMMALQQAVDAEMPGVGQMYSDKRGRLVGHGRGARFDPDTVWTGIAGSNAARDAVWRFRRYKAGDGAAIALDADRAQIRPPLRWSYSEDQTRNVGFAYPKDLTEAQKTSQVYVVSGVDPIDRRVWTAENLLVKAGTTTGNTGAQEAYAYATFWAEVLSVPRVRVEALTFKSIPTGHPQAEPTWDLMLNADISDIIDLEHGVAGGVGVSEEWYVEGSEMTVRPLNSEMDMVTVTFNVSPVAYYADDMGLMG